MASARTKREPIVRDWVERSCPHIWAILNARAQRCLPAGLIEYVSPPPPEKYQAKAKEFPELGAEYFKKVAEEQVEAGRLWLQDVDKKVAALIGRLGDKAVCDAYRRDLSGIGSEDQVAELFCEIAVCAAVSEISGSLDLRPGTNEGKHCDFRAFIADHEVWGEVKRYEDRWWMDSDRDHRRGRALSMGTFKTDQGKSDRPRAEEVRSKLDGRAPGKPPDGVPEQFLNGKINVLFVFHSPSLDSERDLRAALFGDAYYFEGLATPEIGLSYGSNGLFVLDRWRRVSACCWATLSDDGAVRFRRLWHNPLAEKPLPAIVVAQFGG